MLFEATAAFCSHDVSLAVRDACVVPLFFYCDDFKAVRDWERCHFRAQITIAITIRANKACILLLNCPLEVLGTLSFLSTFVVCSVFYVPISMNIMREQPRRTWPQNVPYSHLTGFDTEGGIVGPLRFSLREEGPPCAISIALLSRVAVARGLCRCLSHPMLTASD